jgi:gliding motility-associated-like protein
VNVTVNPSPIITAVNNQTICNGSQTNAVTFANNLTGTTYAWTNNTPSIGLAASGTGNIAAFTGVNAGSAPVTATISVTGTNSGCTSSPATTFTITVNPTPTVNNFTNQTVCAGSSNAAVVPTGTVTGTTYSWTNSNPAIGLAASGTGTIPAFTAVNAGATAITSTITVTPATGGLSGTVFGEVNENGTLILNAPSGTFFTGVQFASFGTPTGTLGNYTISSCHSNTSSSVVSNLALGQTTVSIYANGSLFGDPCPGVGKRLAVVLTYGTGQPSCSGTSKTYTITVNPTPVVANKTVTICSGTAFTATTGGSDVVPAGTQYTWTVAPNANVTGASNQATGVSTISQTLTNTSNTVQTVTYNVTAASGSCTTTFTVTVTVNPTPVLSSSLTAPTLCAPNFFSYTAVSPTVAASGSTVLSWARQANPGIHEAPTSGTGNISGDLLTNITNSPVTVTYLYTVTSNGCSSNYNVTVVANPLPYQGFAYNPGAWSGAGVGLPPAFGNNAQAAQVFVHNTNKPINSISAVFNPYGPTGSFPISVAVHSVDVNGVPTNTVLASSTITPTFTGGMINHTWPLATPLNLTNGTKYALVFSMSGGAFSLIGPPSANDSYPYGYIYTSYDNGSTWLLGPTDRDVLFSMTYVETVCSDATFIYNFTSPTVGATATWSRAAVAGISQPAATGTGSISEVLTNTTNNVITVAYNYSITANGCTRNETVYVKVNPTPSLSSTLTPASICSNSSFTYTPASATQLISGSYSFSWSRAVVAGISQAASTGVGNINEVLTNTTMNPIVVSYVYTVTANGCTGTSTVTVTVNPSPLITAQSNNACSGVAVTLAPANGGGNVVPTGTTYTWTVVDNPNVVGETNANTAQNSIVQTLVNAYTSAQQVVYTVTPSFNGCVGTPFTYTVTVSTPVTVAALTGATNVCLGSTTQLASATSGGVWTSSNTAVATVSSTGVVSGLTTGSTTISYTVTNSVGCTGVVTANVNVNALPVATITPSGATTFCQGSSVTLTASAGASYLWSNGLQTQAITVNTAGNYSVQVFNAAGCVTTSSAVAVVVNALPTATITASGSTTFCQGGSVTLTASAGSSYLWSNGATTQSITATTSGCYSVTVTNANGCSATSACTQVTVNALPVATISSLNGNSFCQGGSVTLVSTPGSIYAWSNGLQTQSINVTASANLTVTVTNANGCFATSAPFAVTMNALPTAVITAGGPTTFCQGGSVVLTATGGTSYTWSNSTSTSNTLTVSTPGVYTVTATNANGCTATSAPVTVTVNALPVVAAIAGANDVCVGSTSILTNATPSGVWTSSNAAVATVSATGTVTGVTAGSATINYTVTNASGCVTTTSMLVNVNAVPVNIPIGGPNTVCVGATITNFATPGGVWSSSNVSVATVAQNGIITGVGAGTATISYTITNAAGCSNTVTKVVTVNALPTVAVAANGPLTFCQGGSVTLTASGGTSYAWDNSTITTPARTITTSGTYTVTVTNASGCFATSAPVVVNVLALPNAAIASTGSTICLGNTVTLTASGGVSYAWSNGAQTAATTVNNSNTYTVTVTGANGCTNTASNVVTVNANPAVVTTANGPLTFCQGGSVTLNATGAASYIWSNGTLGSSNIITQSGTYYVQGTNAAGCTSNSAVVTVTVLPTPVVAALTGSNTVCEASTITLSSATPGGVWTSSNGFVATVNNSGVVTGMNAGTTTITYTLSNGACNSSVSASVTVLNSPATPVITAAGPTTVCPGETVTLFSSNAPNYQWNSGQQTNGIVVTQSGTYDITVTGSNGCAVTSLPITVTIGDDVAPIIVAPLNVNVNPNLGCTAVGVALGTPVVSDNCTVASVTNNAPGLFPIGTTTVTWTVTDGAGNTATATQLVNVVDQIAPEATAPANVTVNTNNFCDATGVNLGTPEATDNCTIASIVNDAPASFPIGTTVVTWTITDATGNFTTVTQNVTVVDTEAPVVVLQSAAVQLDANGVGVLTFAAIDNGSSDNCGIAEVTIDQTTFDCGQVGFNTVTVTITDNSGNQSEAQVIINVIASDACGGADVAGPQVPDAFTPNGNSINDTWVIPGLEGYNTKEMAVYSRYGTLVYYSGAYANDWDGTLMGNGVAVPDGTYYYTLTLDGGKQLSGYVYINRVKQ